MELKKYKLAIRRYISDISLGSAIQNPVKEDICFEINKLLNMEKFSALKNYLKRKSKKSRNENHVEVLKNQIKGFGHRRAH